MDSRQGSGVARVAELEGGGSKQWAMVSVRGASIYSSPKGWRYINQRSQAARGPQQLTHFIQL